MSGIVGLFRFADYLRVAVEKRQRQICDVVRTVGVVGAKEGHRILVELRPEDVLGVGVSKKVEFA